MNLHSIVGPLVGTVSPSVSLTLLKSTGYTTAADGSRTPTYAAPVTVQGDVQALQYNDIAQLDGINIEGEARAIYLGGNWEGAIRDDQSGGDMITFPDGSVWLVVRVLENWGDTDGWVKVAAVRQNGS